MRSFLFFSILLCTQFRSITQICPCSKARYRSVFRKRYRDQHFPKGAVEDHHVIPKQFKKHPVIIEGNFDINCAENLLLMASRRGPNVFLENKHARVHPGTAYHSAHMDYNNFVRTQLEYIQKKSNEYSTFCIFSDVSDVSDVSNVSDVKFEINIDSNKHKSEFIRYEIYLLRTYLKDFLEFGRKDPIDNDVHHHNKNEAQGNQIEVPTPSEKKEECSIPWKWYY